MTSAEWATVMVAVAAASLPAVMPVMVAAMADQPDIGTIGAGYLVSTNMAGIFLGSLLSAFLARHYFAHRLLIGGLLGMVAGNVLTLSVSTLPTLLLSRAASGLGEGIAAGICYSLMSATRRPALILAYYTAGQAVIGFIGMASLPGLVAWYDWQAFYIVMSGVGLLVLPFVRHAATLALPAPSSADKATSGSRSPHALAMLGVIFVFFAAMALIWAFLQRIGVQQGFSLAWVAGALSSSAVAGLLGSLTAARLSTRISRRTAVWLGIALACATAALLAIGRPQAFLAGAWLLSFAWAFQFPFLFRQLAGYDGGRVAALTPMATGTALSAGPALGGLLLVHAGITTAILIFVSFSVGAVLACLTLPASDAELSQ